MARASCPKFGRIVNGVVQEGLRKTSVSQVTTRRVNIREHWGSAKRKKKRSPLIMSSIVKILLILRIWGEDSTAAKCQLASVLHLVTLNSGSCRDFKGLVVQGLGIHLAMQGTQVQSLARDLRSHLPRSSYVSPRASTEDPA